PLGPALSSSVLRACTAHYYTSCLPEGLRRSGSTSQLNGCASAASSASAASPAPARRPPAPDRPHRTHSERSSAQRTSRQVVKRGQDVEKISSEITTALYRSNSSLDLEHGCEQPGLRGPVRRDYGSASSLDLLAASAGDGSFFAMLREYRAGKREDQRSPGPANIHEFLRGRLDPAPALQNASNALAHGAVDEASSPRLKTKFQRLLELRDRGKGWSRLPGGQESSLFRKWKPGGRSESTDVRAGSADASAMAATTAAVLLPDPAEERIRRRALAHHDCQSLGANLSRASGRLATLLGRRRNTTTGASAASMAQRSARGEGVEGVPDVGDGRQSALLLSCPFFRNEVGGEPQRALGLSRATSRTLPQHGGSHRGGTMPGPWHRPAAMCGVAVLERDGAEEAACPYQRPPTLLEGVDRGALYYRTHFHGKGHQNWFGLDERLGPVAVSLRKERPEGQNSRSAPGAQHQALYRVIVRTSEANSLGQASNGRLGAGSNHGATLPVRELLELAAPELQGSCLRLAMPGPATEQQLLKLDEQGLMKTYKVGVMYCKAGQSTEEEMYNNELAGPAFEEFLEMLGHRVRLKGFQNYRAGLDNKTDTTGLYSVYSTYEDCEIMFHVSTLLPYTPSNKQQLLRKRHIGNDIVTLVFQEPRALPFTPKNIRSHFQHVFIIVRAIEPCSDKTRYSVAVSRSKEVPVFGPPIPEGATFAKSKKFTDFILAKVINAENAAHRSEKFATMAQRTRQEYLKDLASNYSTSTTLDSGANFAFLLPAAAKAARERPALLYLPDDREQVEDQGQGCVCDCLLGVSVSSLVLLDEMTGEPLFGCPTGSLLGWSSHTGSLKLFYHQGECIVLRTKDSDVDEVQEIVTRLACVTSACETQELMLCRNTVGQLGFHVQYEGLVTEVEPHGLAWEAGLRRGCRLLEICKVAVATLSYDQMVDLLKTSVMVSVTVVPPHKDGSPRRGCPLQNCSYFASDYEGAGVELGGGGVPSPPRGHASAVGQQVPSYAKARARNDLQFRSANQSQRICDTSSEERPSPVPPPVPARMARSPPGRTGGSPCDRSPRQACTSLPPLVAPTAHTGSSRSGGSSPSLASLLLLEPLAGPLVVSRSELSLAQLSHEQQIRVPGLHPRQARHGTLDTIAAPRDALGTQFQRKSQGDLSSVVSTSSLALDRCCGGNQTAHSNSSAPLASGYQSDSSSEWALGAGSSADELSTCSGSHLGSPLPKRGLCDRGPAHSPKVRLSCRVGMEAGEARSPLSAVRPAQPLALRAGGAVSLSACSSRSPSSVKGSSSAGSTSSGPGSGGSTLQEDLLKLIGPDYLDSDGEDTTPWCPQSAPERPRSGPATPSSSLERVGRRQGLALRCRSSCPSSAEDVILTTAQPAQVIACPDPSPPPPPPPPPSSDRGTQPQEEKPQPQRRLHDLEERVVQLQETLAQEQHHKANLEHQVRQLRQENHRLHEQSQSASAQLKRLTDWFFGSPDA
ncbi:unnamed protein product, partial [Ixodes hexagonus]